MMVHFLRCLHKWYEYFRVIHCHDDNHIELFSNARNAITQMRDFCEIVQHLDHIEFVVDYIQGHIQDVSSSIIGVEINTDWRSNGHNGRLLTMIRHIRPMTDHDYGLDDVPDRYFDMDLESQEGECSDVLKKIHQIHEMIVKLMQTMYMDSYDFRQHQVIFDANALIVRKSMEKGKKHEREKTKN